jgi:hypothetical protein
MYSYETIWDTFYLIAQNATAEQQEQLFRRTAAEVYRLDIDDR